VKVLENSTHNITLKPPNTPAGPSVAEVAPSSRNQITLEVYKAKQSLKESIETRMKHNFKSNPLEYLRINKSMLQGFEGFRGELSKYWENAAGRTRTETLRMLVQDNTWNERRNEMAQRSVQTHSFSESSQNPRNADAQSDDLSGLLDTAVSDMSPSDTLVSEQKDSLEASGNESLEPAESIDELLAQVGSDLELAILTDRLTQSAHTIISLQSDLASAEDQLPLVDASQNESLAQQDSQEGSELEYIVPVTANQDDKLDSVSSSSAVASDNLSTARPDVAEQTTGTETASKSTESEISAPVERDSPMKSAANPWV